MKTLLTILLALHVCAAVDWFLMFKEFFVEHEKLAKVSEKVGWIWAVQSALNLVLLIIVALATFDGDELRMALYRLTLSERGKDEEFDMKVDSIVAFKDATRTPGEPAWVTKISFGGMIAIVAIWLLALIR
jgi:hypothetical protein